MSSLAALKRVDNEVMAQTTLRHRGILHIHDIFNGRRGLYLIMEKVGPPPTLRKNQFGV